MPKKIAAKTYPIDELSPEVREAVMVRLRERAFDETHVQWLSEDFENTLEEKGIDGADVNWSLGYCQGDGVCFKGTIDSAKVIQSNKLKEFKPLLPAAKLGLLYGRIHHDDTRSCHSNSMTVELELRGDATDLLPRDLLEIYQEWKLEYNSLSARWGRERYEVQERNLRARRVWQERVENWEKVRGRTVKDWSPRPGDPFHPPGAEPAHGSEQMPPEPVFPMPEDLRAAIASFDEKWKTMESLTDKYREWLARWVQQVSKELEKSGYEEIEYRQSDEAIIEELKANDARFTEDGDRV